jgi:hypothetical protein
MAWTVVYLITGYLGNKKQLGIKKGILSFVKNPMIFALFFGIMFGILNIQLPQIFAQFKTTLSGFINPLLFVAIGILLDFKYFSSRENLSKLFLSAGIVMGISAIWLISLLFYRNRSKVILVSAVSPAAAWRWH